jgi:hypothetical protein
MVGLSVADRLRQISSRAARVSENRRRARKSAASVGRAAAARVCPQIVAHDGFVQSFQAVGDGDGRRRRFPAAQRGLVAFIGVMIGVDFGLIAEQHEQIAVPAPGEAHFGLLAQHACRPPIHQVLVSSQEGYGP